MSGEPRIAAPFELEAMGYTDALKAIETRLAQTKMTYETFEAIAGWQKGYAAKVFNREKHIHSFHLFLAARALGLSVTFRECPWLVALVQDKWTQRVRPRGMLASASIIEITPDMLRLRAQMGGLVRAQKLSPKKRSRIARKAAKVRWSKPRVVEVKGAKAKQIRKANA